uniref:Annexin n=1 Tax=Aegilops tauschii subsp. strangulata TaxID=200361 RepID=A0A453PIW4_AEGTS
RAVTQWTLDPAERDAELAGEEAKKWQPGGRALVEIACARTPAQLFAAKQAYHDRFKRSLEEDVAAHVTGDFRKVRHASPLFDPSSPLEKKWILIRPNLQNLQTS